MSQPNSSQNVPGSPQQPSNSNMHVLWSAPTSTREEPSLSASDSRTNMYTPRNADTLMEQLAFASSIFTPNQAVGSHTNHRRGSGGHRHHTTEHRGTSTQDRTSPPGSMEDTRRNYTTTSITGNRRSFQQGPSNTTRTSVQQPTTYEYFRNIVMAGRPGSERSESSELVRESSTAARPPARSSNTPTTQQPSPVTMSTNTITVSTSAPVTNTNTSATSSGAPFTVTVTVNSPPRAATAGSSHYTNSSTNTYSNYQSGYYNSLPRPHSALGGMFDRSSERIYSPHGQQSQSHHSFHTHTQSSPSSARPQFRSKAVCELSCKYCSNKVCKRGMKAILLADMAVELFSTDMPPQGVSLVNDDYQTRKCYCRIRDVACLGCGNVIGYHVTQPCQSCMDACNNGHFWMFHVDHVDSAERMNAAGTKPLLWANLGRPDCDVEKSDAYDGMCR